MKTTKNKIIKGIKTLSKAPLYCAIFVSAGLSCTGQEIIPTIKDNNNEQNTIIDTEIDHNRNESMGQYNLAYQNSSTSEDEHNNVDENNNLDENNNEVETHNNAEEVCAEQKKEPHTPPKASKEDNQASKKPKPVKNDDTKPSDKPDQPKQNINKKTRNTASSSPKKDVPDDKKEINTDTRVYKFQLQKNGEDKSSESGGATKQDTRLSKNIQDQLEKLKEKRNSLEKLAKDPKIKNPKAIKEAEDVLNEHTIASITDEIKDKTEEFGIKYIEKVSILFRCCKVKLEKKKKK